MISGGTESANGDSGFGGDRDREGWGVGGR